MREEHDISKLDPRPNPYAKTLKKQITINLSDEVISYFKDQATEVGILHQTLINMYLMGCVKNHRKIDISWK